MYTPKTRLHKVQLQICNVDVVLLCCSCDGGRVCRPLIICDNGVPRVTTGHINKLKAGEWGFTDFLKRGEQGGGGVRLVARQ